MQEDDDYTEFRAKRSRVRLIAVIALVALLGAAVGGFLTIALPSILGQ